MTRSDNCKFSLLTLVIVCSLSACSGPSLKPSQGPVTQQNDTQNPEQLLSRAAITRNSMEKNRLLYQAAKLYLSSGLPAQAQALFAELDRSLLPSSERMELMEYQLTQALQNNDVTSMKRLLSTLNPDEWLQTDVAHQVARVDLMEQAYTATEQHFEAAKLLIAQRGILLDDAKYNDLIWRHLGRSNALTLNQYKDTSDNYDMQGWLNLWEAIRFRENELQQQFNALINWQKEWPLHPAAIQLPQELEILSRLPENKAREIILALPFTGPLGAVGEAIRDGFVARYYQSSDFAELKIRFYDTQQQDFLALYDEMLDPQSIIIGPLEKTNLAKLLEWDTVPFKTIALNELPLDHFVGNLYQFSLNPVHESTQIIERLEAEKQNRVAILAPESDWGLRIYDRLAQELQQTTGQLISSAFYQDQKTLSQAVSKLLSTDKSKARARKLRQITGLRLESTPRRRQDLDAVIMIATPEVARQLKPLLAYHYASDLPVYASSQINTGDKKENDRDLNGIRFLDMPWALRNAIDIKEQLEKNFANKAKQYSRFYAMGVDAFQIAPRIEILTQVENSHIDGQTGMLSIDAENKVQRSLQWARFRGGRPVITN